MKALRYKARVCEGVLASIHGSYMLIPELFVPELNLFINSHTAFIGSKLDESRIPPKRFCTEVHLEPDFVATLGAFAESLRKVDCLGNDIRNFLFPTEE